MVVDTDAVTKQLEAAARTRRFDLWGFEFAAATETLGNDCGKRIDCRRTDDVDVVATGLCENAGRKCQANYGSGSQGGSFAMNTQFGYSQVMDIMRKA